MVDRAGFLALMRGRGPVDRSVLRSMRACSTVAALDLTFSAPKSVSVLFAVADDDLSAAVRDAHEWAVDQALEYLEREAVAPAAVIARPARRRGRLSAVSRASMRLATRRLIIRDLEADDLAAMVRLWTDLRCRPVDGRLRSPLSAGDSRSAQGAIQHNRAQPRLGTTRVVAASGERRGGAGVAGRAARRSRMRLTRCARHIDATATFWKRSLPWLGSAFMS